MKQKIKPVHLNLIKLRHKLNITQSQYADKLNISTPLLGAIESGRSQPRIEVISKALVVGNISKQDMHDFVFDFNYIIPN